MSCKTKVNIHILLTAIIHKCAVVGSYYDFSTYQQLWRGLVESIEYVTVHGGWEPIVSVTVHWVIKPIFYVTVCLGGRANCNGY